MENGLFAEWWWISREIESGRNLLLVFELVTSGIFYFLGFCATKQHYFYKANKNSICRRFCLKINLKFSNVYCLRSQEVSWRNYLNLPLVRFYNELKVFECLLFKVAKNFFLNYLEPLYAGRQTNKFPSNFPLAYR